MPCPLQFLVLTLAGFIQRKQQDVIDYLLEENRVLREQLGHRRVFFTDIQRRRLARRAHQLGRAGLQQLATIVTPDTLLRWGCQPPCEMGSPSGLRASRFPPYACSADGLRARGGTFAERPLHVVSLMDFEVKCVVARSTVARVLHESGIDPAPNRTVTWSTFLESHWGAVAATDFFSVEVLTRTGLVRYLVLFVMDLKSRRVHIANIAAQPGGELLEQIARNLTDPFDGFLRKHRFLIHDRDPLFTKSFAAILRDAGVRTLKLPARSPNLNAYAERFVGSIRRECLDHIIPLGEAHLRHVVREYVEHYNAERPHQGLDNHLIDPRPPPENDNGAIQTKRRLGGLLNFYHRGAA